MRDPSSLPLFAPVLPLCGLAIVVCYALAFAPALTTARGYHTYVAPNVTQALDEAATVRVIITLRDPPALESSVQDLAAARSRIAQRQARVLDALPPGDLAVSHRYAALPAIAGAVTARGLAALASDPDVEAIELDAIGSAATSQSLPLIHASEVHTAGITGDGVVVAVLDTGIDTNHPDLADDIAYERCYLVAGSCGPGAHPAEDDNGHGTNVSGIITSNGTTAPKGVAPDAKIAAYKILAASGTGFFSDWLLALDDIINSHPEVDFVNMSLQSTVACPYSAMATAIATLRAQGVLTFIAAANHGVKNALTVPACLTDGISVGAVYDANIGTVNGWKLTTCSDVTTAADQVACWSNSSSELDLLAPGAAISSAGKGGGTSTYRGTSQATPHAAGVAALLLEAMPGLTAGDIENRMEATGKLITDDLDDADPATNRTTPRIDARVASIADAADTDGDGCSNIEEYGPDPEFGGKRNPLDPYDFYDVNGDGAIDLFNDILTIAFAFGLTPADAGYSPILDRSEGPPGAELWDLGPPDGSITLFSDIFAAALQFGADCSALP